MYDTVSQSCPVCQNRVPSRFLKLRRVPVNCSALYPTREAALSAERGDIELAFCRNCGMIFNAEFESSRIAYDPSYENSLRFSPAFCDYTNTLAARLLHSHGLKGKDIVEIGCGDGEFLRQLCVQGNNRGVGFDPSFNGSPIEGGFRFLRQHYDEAAAKTPADFICCRHVLEHMASPADLLRSAHLALSARADSTAYFEVPNATAVLRGPSTWDVNYPHCGYFTAPPLTRLFESCEFTVLRVGSDFGGQFLFAEVAPATSTARAARIADPGEVQQVARMAEGFRLRFREAVEGWARFLEYAYVEGRRVVLWGAGAKGVTFLNLIPGTSRVIAVVDLNPRKVGCYVPGTGHEITPPTSLVDLDPEIIITLNPVYETEIRKIARELGLAAQVVTKPGLPIFQPQAPLGVSAAGR